MRLAMLMLLLLTGCMAGKQKSGKVWDEYVGRRTFRINLDCRDGSEAAQTKLLKKCAELTLREEHRHFTLAPDLDNPEMTLCTLHNAIDKPPGAFDAEKILRLCEFMQKRFDPPKPCVGGSHAGSWR